MTQRLTTTFVALLVLLLATYLLAKMDLAPFNAAIGLFIAAAKASLVMLEFMHIRTSSGVQRIAAAVGVFWLGILMSLSLSDYFTRNWLELPGPWPKETPSQNP